MFHCGTSKMQWCFQGDVHFFFYIIVFCNVGQDVQISTCLMLPYHGFWQTANGTSYAFILSTYFCFSIKVRIVKCKINSCSVKKFSHLIFGSLQSYHGTIAYIISLPACSVWVDGNRFVEFWMDQFFPHICNYA